MHPFTFILSLSIAGLSFYQAVKILLNRIQQRRKARQLGCQDAPLYPYCGFLGLKHIKQIQTADASNLFPDFLVERQQDMSRIAGRVCGTFRYSVLGQQVHFTSDPENIKAMLATNFPDFDTGHIRRAIVGEVLGDGIFVQDGKAWEHSRAMLRPNFVREQISDLEMEERHVQILFDVLAVQEDGWTASVNIQELFFRLTMDTATEFLCGESVNSQLAGATHQHVEASSFGVNFDQAQLHMAKKFRLVEWHWLRNPAEYQANIRVINDFAKRYVDKALAKGSTLGSKTQENEKYVFLQAFAKQTSDPVELRAQMLNILLAGRDTTASLLSWVFHEMLRKPQVYEKLRSVILDTFGTYESPNDISFSRLKGCQYLQYTLNETLRLWSLNTLNARTANKDTTLPCGGGLDGKSPVFIPAGAQVDFSTHVLHRRKDLWGEDADEFRPERFVGRRPGWEFLPFSGGARICIGQQLALTEAGYVIVRLLQRFDRIEAAEEDLEGPVLSDLGLTNCPAKPVTLRLRGATKRES